MLAHLQNFTYGVSPKYADLDNELVNNVSAFLGWIKHIAPHGIVTVFAAGTIFSAVKAAVAQSKTI